MTTLDVEIQELERRLAVLKDQKAAELTLTCAMNSKDTVSLSVSGNHVRIRIQARSSEWDVMLRPTEARAFSAAAAKLADRAEAYR